MKTVAALFALMLFAAVALGQETTRRVDAPGEFDKFLTPGLLDNWIIQGEKGETIIVHVSSREFDPVLKLAAKGDVDDKVLISVDDKGSESRFSLRLPKKGEYKIQVHAFEFKGGGNYRVRIRRFLAEPIAIGKRPSASWIARAATAGISMPRRIKSSSHNSRASRRAVGNCWTAGPSLEQLGGRRVDRGNRRTLVDCFRRRRSALRTGCSRSAKTNAERTIRNAACDSIAKTRTCGVLKQSRRLRLIEVKSTGRLASSFDLRSAGERRRRGPAGASDRSAGNSASADRR